MPLLSLWYISAQVNWTKLSTTLSHKTPLLGVQYISAQVNQTNLVPLLTTGCLYWGVQYIWAQVNWTQPNTTHGHKLPLLGVQYIWAQVIWTQLITTQPQDASISRYGTSHLRSTAPKLVPLLATRCLYWGDGTSELRSTRSNFLQLMATRCLYWGADSFLGGGYGGACPQTHIHHTDFISRALLGCAQLEIWWPSYLPLKHLVSEHHPITDH